MTYASHDEMQAALLRANNTISEMAGRISSLEADLRLESQENTHLRQMVAWCAPQIPEAARPELVRMVKEKTVVDLAEDMRSEDLALLQKLEALTDLVQKGIDADEEKLPALWWQQLDEQCRMLRGFLPKEQSPPTTLHEVRQGLL